MADVIVTAVRNTFTANVSVSPVPTISVTATAAQAPSMPLTVAVERKAITVAVVPTEGAASNAYVHNQSTPASEWSVTHTLGVRPASILLLDETGNYMIPCTAEVSATRVVLLFGSPTVGTLVLKGQ